MIKDTTIDALGNSFFEEEIRNEFPVSKKMKHIWAVEIDLYLEFARICEKYNLQYFVFWGSLLGAIRHGGFIPWDDDMDVAMMRKDYEIFLQVASSELKAPYFLQTPYTDPGAYFSLARLRNSSTTGMIQSFRHNRFNQGIWLDIDVIDFCDIDAIEENRTKIFPHVMRCATYMRKGAPNLDEKRKQELITYTTDDPLADFEAIHKIANNPAYKDSEYVNIANVTAYTPQRQTWKKQCFDSVTDISFENIKVKVPSGYDEILRTTYGDYMQFPPVENRGAWHGGNFFDPFNPYTEYIIKGSDSN